MPPKRKVRDENTTNQIYSSLWKNYAFMRGYRVIFIIIFIFILFLIYPYIHFILYDSETQKSEDGNIPTIQNEFNIIKEKKEDTKNTRNKESDVSKLESNLPKLQNNQDKMVAETSNILLKLTQLEHDINDIIDKDLEKENIMKKQFENAFNAIRMLEGTMKQHSENAIGTLEEIMKQKFENVFYLMQKLKEDMMQQKADLERQVGLAEKADLERRVGITENAVTKCSKKNENLSNKISKLELKVHQQMTKSNKESKENEVRGITSKHVDILQIGVIIILFIYIIRATWTENFKEKEIERRRFRGRDTRKPSEDVPLIISFSEDCKRSHEDLTRGFVDDYYDSVVINNFRDMRQIHQIHAKVFIVFVDCNELNIILEGDGEPQQIRKETVESIMKMGGIPVVIYHFHSDSRKLEGRHLYSSKLTSIQDHPLLKDLSSKDRVLSIDQHFSEYQISHLKNICNV